MKAYRMLSPKVIAELDSACFPSDDPYPFEGADWWIYKTKTGNTAAFCGIKILDGNNRGGAFMCRAGVLPEYSGHGLQRKMLRLRENHARKKGCDHILTYTSKDNYESIANLIRSGYRFFDPSYPWAGKDFFYYIKYL